MCMMDMGRWAILTWDSDGRTLPVQPVVGREDGAVGDLVIVVVVWGGVSVDDVFAVDGRQEGP